MALTGPADRAPLGPPAGLEPGLGQIAGALARQAEFQRCEPAVDPWQYLVDRAAVSGFSRRGDVSCGGASRLLPTRDGWVAVSLSREADLDLVPAWLALSAPSGDVWADVAGRLRHLPAAEVVSRARLLGLPVAVPGEVAPCDGDHRPEPDAVRGGSLIDATGLLVLDLSSLWAGPLCSHILGSFGARVIKVESFGRPDGARQGPPAFFDLVNGGKEGVAFDFTSPGELVRLRCLLARADIVIEGSRPRALAQLGILPDAVIAHSGGVWVSITGYGREGPGADWVAFGDDAAVAGGLVAWHEGRPCFCADAVADPLTGMTAALAALAAKADGRSGVLDISMARVAADFGGPTQPVPDEALPPRPRARVPAASAPRLGEHNDSVFAEFLP
jgi:hypothetical protein